jgi:hypothetical protein
MKKIVSICFTFFLASLMAVNSVYSQIADGNTNTKWLYRSSQEETSSTKSPASVYLNDINPKAVRNFLLDYTNVTDAKWSKLESGFTVVRFTTDGVHTRILYNRTGLCENVIRDYHEDKLPREIRHIVKRTYYDFSIYFISEVTIKDITAYIIQIEDKTSWKILKVVDGEMEIIRELTKS